SAFSLPGNDAWTEREALKHFNDGLADLRGQRPAQAESSFRSALHLWQKLTDSAPARPGDRHNLAVTHQKRGVALLPLRRGGEASDCFRQALAEYDRLEAVAPGYEGHRPSRQQAEQVLAKVRLIQPARESTAAFQEAERLRAAGDYRAAAAEFSQALERH